MDPAPPVDFDLDFDDVQTQPSELEGDNMPLRRRALIASGLLEERLYLRAKLALAGLSVADEAESAAQALELARANDYVLALVDFRLPGADGWRFVRELRRGDHPVGKVIVTASRPTCLDRLRSRFAPVDGFFQKPPHPGKLHELLARLAL